MVVIMELNLLLMIEISKNLTKKWTINQLAQSIGKHYSPVYIAIRRLIKNKILSKDDNNLIQPEYLDTTLLELSELNRTRKLKKKLSIIVDKIAQIPDSFFSAVLFGSSVYKSGRDIDILFIIPESGNIESFQKTINQSIGSFHTMLDYHIVTEASCYEMLNKQNELNVMNEIMKNHLVLYGTQNFYRIVRGWKNGR